MLLQPQIPHHDKLVTVLKAHPCAIDASDTGTGKTYAAVAVAQTLGLKPVIICPFSVKSAWKRTLDLFKVDYHGIANYELIGAGSWHPPAPDSAGLGAKGKVDGLSVTKKGHFTWDPVIFDDKTIFIFDEVHLCKNPLTRNSRLLLSTRELPCKNLLLSATIADKPSFFAVFALMLGLIKTLDEFRLFLRKLRYANIQPNYGVPNEEVVPMLALHHVVFPEYGARLRKEDMGTAFPSNEIKADIYTMDEETTKEIQSQYDYISLISKEAAVMEASAPIKLVEILRARQKIEALKVRTLAELAVEAMENDGSPVIFVNYLDTMALLVDQLEREYDIKVKCLIRGGQSSAERTRIIDEFQSDRENIIICQIRSGGVGISLHDTHGQRPRVAIISPSWSAQDLVQAFGRIHRAQGQTPCIQKVVYCSETVEERVCEIVNQKIINYIHLNDGHKGADAPL